MNTNITVSLGSDDEIGADRSVTGSTVYLTTGPVTLFLDRTEAREVVAALSAQLDQDTADAPA